LPTFALNFSKNYKWFEKPYQKLERVFHQVCKHFEVSLKNPAAPRFFNPLLRVWISLYKETLSLVFDILRQSRAKISSNFTAGWRFRGNPVTENLASSGKTKVTENSQQIQVFSQRKSISIFRLQ